jgi:hypothetical protein
VSIPSRAWAAWAGVETVGIAVVVGGGGVGAVVVGAVVGAGADAATVAVRAVAVVVGECGGAIGRTRRKRFEGRGSMVMVRDDVRAPIAADAALIEGGEVWGRARTYREDRVVDVFFNERRALERIREDDAQVCGSRV